MGPGPRESHCDTVWSRASHPLGARWFSLHGPLIRPQSPPHSGAPEAANLAHQTKSHGPACFHEHAQSAVAGRPAERRTRCLRSDRSRLQSYGVQRSVVSSCEKHQCEPLSHVFVSDPVSVGEVGLLRTSDALCPDLLCRQVYHATVRALSGSMSRTVIQNRAFDL